MSNVTLGTGRVDILAEFDWDTPDADAILLCYGENCSAVAEMAYECGMKATRLTQALRFHLRPFLSTDRSYHTLCSDLLFQAYDDSGCICCLITYYLLE